MNRRLVIAGSVSLVLAAGTGAWVFAQQTRPAPTPAPVAVAVASEVPEACAAKTCCAVACKPAPVFADLPEAVRAAALTRAAEGNITAIVFEEGGEGPGRYVIKYTETLLLNAEGNFVDGC